MKNAKYDYKIKETGLGWGKLIVFGNLVVSVHLLKGSSLNDVNLKRGIQNL